MYKACIFDLDGTLTDTLESLTYSVNETLKELKLSAITGEQCKSFVGNGARYLIECSIKAGGDEEMTLIEDAMKVYGRIFKENCTYHVAPYEGIAETIKELRREGVKLAVLSNKPHLQTVDVVSSFFEDGTFGYVQGQQEGIPRKPDPTALIRIAERFGISPGDCIYVGDSDVDMDTGNAAGMETVGVTWGFRSEEVLVEHGAKHTIHHPQELISIVKKEKR